MSVRPTIYPIKDIEPIRRALGSGDETLVERILAAHLWVYKRAGAKKWLRRANPPDEEVESLKHYSEAFVAGRFVRDQEPGEWRRVMPHLAHALGLMRMSEKMIFGEWKRLGWYEYVAEANDRLDDQPRALLRHLLQGRSLSGRPMDSGGNTLYAWLTAPEVATLAAGLSDLPAKVDRLAGDDWLADFHGELVECLDRCQGRCLLLLG